ncbi:hypothetical protein COV18_05805 [Candidatus Woesearchaeota archaeon CG10_big_fil_rev_8_21_14_0_10_37_12]|nr:MAG: hypothetical protein COV18_05805 [Candidatus Woesearchaeota archaeon CG10_big_fil_rev_8_21_14_0_10_37_12]
MKKTVLLAAIAILLLVVACAPTAPDNGTNETTEEPINNSADTTVDTTDAEDSNGAEEQTQEISESEEAESAEEVDLSDVPKKQVTEGDLVGFPNLRAVDPDGDPIIYTFTAPLNENGEWRTKEGDAGEHVVTITASDGTHTVSQQVLITVLAKNKAPVIMLDQEEPIVALEGETFTLTSTVTDPDGDDVKVTYSGWMTSDTREVSYDEAGLRKVVITATDGSATTAKEVLIQVENVNRAPTISSINNVEIKEGEKIIVRPTTQDPDGDKLVITYSEQFDDLGVWITEAGDAGEYTITITVSDGEFTAEETFNVKINEINKAPVIELDSPIQVREGETVTLTPTITDKEGDEIRVTYSGWMNSNTKRTTYDDAGDHTVTITARDSAGNEAKMDVVISVENVNRQPIFGAGSFN